LPTVRNEVDIPEMKPVASKVINQVDVPKIEMPDIKIPDIEIPRQKIVNDITPPDISITSPVVNIDAPDIKVEAPEVKIPEQNITNDIKSPDIKIESPSVYITTPDIKFSMPDIENNITSPDVRITTPEIKIDSAKEVKEQRSEKIQKTITEETGSEIAKEIHNGVVTLSEILSVQDLIATRLQTGQSISDIMNPVNIKASPQEINIINSPQALKGGTEKSIVGESITDLTLLMRKFSEDNRQVRDYSREGVSHLVNIEANTYGSWQELKLAVIELKTISTNTKPTYSGIGG